MDTVLAVMVQNYNCQFSARDVHRMELVITQKLDFKLNSYTLYDFLKIVSKTSFYTRIIIGQCLGWYQVICLPIWPHHPEVCHLVTRVKILLIRDPW